MDGLRCAEGMTSTLPVMRRFAACVAILVCVSFYFVCCASAQQPPSASIVGRWRSLETSKGGIGAIIEFRSDGTVDFGPGAVLDVPWRIENNQLVLPPATTSGEEQKYTLQWLNDNKLGLRTGASVTELARVGSRANVDNPIIGEWIEHREMAGRNLEARWLIYQGGKLLFIMPIVTQHGSYTISGSALHIILQGPKPESRFESFELSDNLLILSEPEGGNQDRYARY
jgi:hypothetical protein